MNASSSVNHSVKLSKVFGNDTFRAEYCGTYFKNGVEIKYFNVECSNCATDLKNNKYSFHRQYSLLYTKISFLSADDVEVI